MVNGRPATQGEQAAGSKDRPKNFSRHKLRLIDPGDTPLPLFVPNLFLMASIFFLFSQFISQAAR